MKKSIYYCFIFLILSLNVFAADEIEDLLGDNSKKILVKKSEYKPVEGTVIGLKGQVFLRYEKDHVWKQLFKGDKVKEKAYLITMENSEATIKLLNDTNTVIMPKSRVYFTTLRVNPEIETVNETEIQMMAGKVYSNVKKSLANGSRYEVKTGSATAGVRGTQFIVWIDANGNTGLRVFRGVVGLGNSQNQNVSFFRQNEGVIVDSNGRLKKKEKHNENPPEEIIEEPNGENPPGDQNQGQTQASNPSEEIIDDEWINEKFGPLSGQLTQDDEIIGIEYLNNEDLIEPTGNLILTIE